MAIWRFYSIIITIMVLIISGCSGNNSVIPSGQDISTVSRQTSMPVGVTDWNPGGTPSQGSGILGLFELSIKPSNLTAELIPLRKSSLTDVLESVDITNFLKMAPCTDCVKIRSVSMNTDGNIVLSIGIKHPFPAGDIYKPISGKNRGDLHVFNVEGTVISNSAPTAFTGLGERTAGFMLLNADGYSKYMDSAIDVFYPTEATMHPYVMHFDDYSQGNFNASNPMGFESVTTPPPTGNLVMSMGCDYDYQDYVFDLDGSPIDFIYAVNCTYAVSSASKAMRFTPEYRVPQHNKKAASEVSVAIITNNLAPSDTNSSADLEIHVVDINHGVAVGDALDQMFANSSVGSIQLEVPGITTGILTINISSPTGTGHDHADPLIYSTTITNTAGAVEGIYSGLVKVTDSYQPGLNQSPLLNGNDGIKRVGPIENPLTGLFGISEFATYALFTIPVEIRNEQPVADIVPEVVQVITQGSTVVWDASASYDPDGTIVQYEWDFDIAGGDPANFNPDAVTTTPTATQESTPYNDLGNFYAAVRVTDNLGRTAVDVYNFDVLEHIPDLIVDAVRNNYSPMGGWQPCYIMRVNLDWENMPGAVEYAVYRAPLYSSPYAWIQIGTTPTSVTVFDDVNIGETAHNWFDHKFIYEIRPRSIAGDPSSEGTPSQQGLVFMESSNFAASTLHPNFTWRYGSGGSFNAQYSGSWCADETSSAGGVYVNITSWWPQPSSSWQVYYPMQPIPDLAGQSNAYFDFAFTTGGWPFGNALGFAPGTFATPPASDGLSSFNDFDPAVTSDHLLGELYKSSFNSTGFQNFFGEPAGTQAFHSPYDQWRATRYAIPRLLQTDVDYPSIGIASWNTSPVNYSYHIFDSIAIVVY